MDDRLPRYRIMGLAIEQRPRERLAAWGAEQPSDAELVAMLLGPGIRGANALRLAEAVLASVNGLSGSRRIPFDELPRVQGIGPARAAALKAAAALADRMAHTAEARPVMSSPQDVGDSWTSKSSTTSHSARRASCRSRRRASVFVLRAGPGAWPETCTSR